LSKGASLITIHGRYRVNLVARTGAGARDGPAHLDQIAAVKAAVPNIPIISNGNIITWDNVCSNLKVTGCDGVMSAEGILDNPALFSPATRIQKQALDTAVEIFPPILPEHGFEPSVDMVSHLNMAVEYLSLVDKYPTKMKSIVFHIRRMIKQELISYQLLDECLAAQDLETVRRIVNDCVAFKEHTRVFVHDPLKQQVGYLIVSSCAMLCYAYAGVRALSLFIHHVLLFGLLDVLVYFSGSKMLLPRNCTKRVSEKLTKHEW
jgi:tRNA-dihydrouridine synthase